MGRILPIELKEFDATTLSGTPQNFGAALVNPAIKVQFLNTGNTDAYVDATGIPVPFHMRIPARTAITLDESTLYFRGTDQEYYLPRGAQLTLTQFSAPSTAGGSIIAHIITRQLV